MKPRGSGIFTPGTNMAVHRGDQSGGQGDGRDIPSYRLGSGAWALPEPAPPAVPLPWPIGMGTVGQGQEGRGGIKGMGKATVDGTAVSEYNSPIALGFGRSVMPKQVFAAAAILFLIGGTPGLYAAEIDILKKAEQRNNSNLRTSSWKTHSWNC